VTRHAAPLFTVALLTLAPATATAQARLYGTIRDSLQGTPLPLVEVVVDGMNLSTRTDAEGRYALNIPLGFHTILFRRIGYHSATRQVRLSDSDSLRLDVVMLDQAQPLSPVEVEAPAPPRSWPPGLDERMKDGFGQFVTDSNLRRFEHSRLSNVLQSQVSGVRFKRVDGRNVAFSGRGPRMSFGRPVDCYFTVWLDGILLGNQIDLDRFAVVSLEAIEVFHSAQLPSQYRGRSAGCGAILLWSRTQRR